MKTSDSITKIAPALLAAQRKITFAVKDSKNPAFRSTYADLSSVIEACKPALNEAGIVFIQMPSESDSGTLALTTRLMHESGEWIEATAMCPLPKLDPQGYGSANTYLRRYSLAAAVGLYQDDDDGNAASQSRGKASEQAPAKSGNVAAAGGKKTAEEVVKGIVDGVKAGDAKGAAAYLASLQEPALKKLWDKIPEDVQDELTVNWPEVAA